MPPRRKVKKQEEVSTDTTENVVPMEPIVMQLPISSYRMDELLSGTDMQNILEYNPKITEPQPYTPEGHFISGHDAVQSLQSPMGDDFMATQKESVGVTGTMDSSMMEVSKNSGMHGTVCFWCCHEIDHMEYGMPIRYDVLHKNFTMYGSFCSLQCAAAYNFDHHMGSDRAWEIHSWIQMLGNRYGLDMPIRPAPSKYLLKMFQGPMTIEEFRKAHRGQDRTYILNIPPFIHVSSQMEVLNTSFLDHTDAGAKPKKRTLIDKKTIERKLPCTIIDESI